jgi:hypothetical protein
MGIVHDGARPGDPMSYHFRGCGTKPTSLWHLPAAAIWPSQKSYRRGWPKNDFFGGFGSEADAPGLAILSLTAMAKQLDDLHYDSWLWPHIRRKAEHIVGMLSSDRPST